MTLDDDLDQQVYSARFDVQKLTKNYEKLGSDTTKQHKIMEKGDVIQNSETKNMKGAKDESLTEDGSSTIDDSGGIEIHGQIQEDLAIFSEETRKFEEENIESFPSTFQICGDTQGNSSVIVDLAVVDKVTGSEEESSSNKDLHRTESSSSAFPEHLDVNSHDLSYSEQVILKIPNSNTDCTENLKIDSNDFCDSGQVIPSNLNAEDGSKVDSKDACTTTQLNSSAPISVDESQVDSECCFSPPPVFAPRPAFKPRGRMFKRSVAPQAAPAQFIMDVPEMWGVGADGSMMEAFNKLEIKK